MEKNPDVGAAQPLLLKTNSPDQIDCREAMLDYLGYSYMPAKDAVLKNLPHGIISSSYIGLGLFRTEALKKSSFQGEFFDSLYRIHWFDIDASWRILLAGYKVAVVLDSVIYHNRGVSRKRQELPALNVFLNNRNWMMTLIKNYSIASLMQFIAPLLCLKLAEFLALMKRNPDHAIATLHGLFWPIKNLKSVWLKRLIVQHRIRRLPDSQILKNFIPPNLLLLYRMLGSHYPD